ncbi:MAG: hypothetical protein IJ379_11520, partial [Lachnospiraceae bacterium]|nr:hypothetical protein [Lachnospiraceae bacterium]
MSLDFLLMVKVTFFSKSKRKAPPNISAGRYSPHLVVKGDVEYLGVSFIELQSSEFDVETEAIVLPVY